MEILELRLLRDPPLPNPSTLLSGHGQASLAFQEQSFFQTSK